MRGGAVERSEAGWQRGELRLRLTHDRRLPIHRAAATAHRAATAATVAAAAAAAGEGERVLIREEHWDAARA